MLENWRRNSRNADGVGEETAIGQLVQERNINADGLGDEKAKEQVGQETSIAATWHPLRSTEKMGSTKPLELVVST